MLKKNMAGLMFFPQIFRNFAQPACGPTQGPTRRAKIGYVNNFCPKKLSARAFFWFASYIVLPTTPLVSLKSLRFEKNYILGNWRGRRPLFFSPFFIF